MTAIDGVPVSTATLRDISATGARISVSTVLSVPKRFRLTVDIDGMSAECEMVWRKPGEIGVRFLSQPKYETPLRRQVIQMSRAIPGKST